jgi:hypothetical protein
MYSWATGSTGSTITVAPAVTTTYNLTGLSAQGCSATASVTVTVSNVSIVLTVLPASLCEGETALLSASGANTYTWDNGLSAGASNVVSPAATTTYHVTGSDTYGCSGTAAITVTVNPLPATPVITQNGTNLTTGTATTYQWFVDGTFLSGMNTQSITPDQTGNFTVVVTNAQGCSATSAPFYFELSGLSESNQETIIFVPNPTNGYVQFVGEMLQKGSYSIDVSDALGNNVMHLENTAGADLSDLSDGIYFIVISDNSGRHVTGKIILNKL